MVNRTFEIPRIREENPLNLEAKVPLKSVLQMISDSWNVCVLMVNFKLTV